ncbi:hypothetical protein NM208_g9123 [Fusarium decemcellulare]|uniref:Uncharacterized protein n=1 Tax=Fusarium decemcellulare TaxID=57161 RepID=A0ACC1S2S6_9HYPO|nr:hypothetical protein NM208_g9123 [Fusarium decemcellulare]
MSSKTHFLALPYEVRHQIYQHYFMVDGGYVYDGDSEKLVTADGQPIDLSLMYACHSIADDTKHIPLSLNPITFSTVCREDWRDQAGGLEFIMGYHHQLQSDIIFELVRFMTPEMYYRLGLKFPEAMPDIRSDLTGRRDMIEEYQGPRDLSFYRSRKYKERLTCPYDFKGIMRSTRYDGLQWIWGVTRSSISGALGYTLRLLAEKHPVEFGEVVDKALPGWLDSHSSDEFFDPPFDLWAIPSLSEVAAVGHQLQALSFWNRLDSWHHTEQHDAAGTGNRCREKLYFSAAAIAIRFLNLLPQHQRLHVRNIIINEDRLAVGHPEGHALGLIPFCRENPRLKVERRVNLWRNLLLRTAVLGPCDAIYLVEGDPSHYFDRERSKLNHVSVNNELALWGFHAREVMDEGMPAGSFTFVLDGEPDLNLSYDIFDGVVHQGVAWAKAYSEGFSRGLFPNPDRYLSRRSLATVIRGIEHLIGGASFIRSNFDIGQPWDYEKLIEAHKDLPSSAWRNQLMASQAPYFDTSSPILDLTEAMLEFFEQQKESDYLESPQILCKREKKRLRRVRRRWAAMFAAQKPTQVAEANAEDEDEDDGENVDNLVSQSDAKMGLVMRTSLGMCTRRRPA